MKAYDLLQIAASMEKSAASYREASDLNVPLSPTHSKWGLGKDTDNFLNQFAGKVSDYNRNNYADDTYNAINSASSGMAHAAKTIGDTVKGGIGGFKTWMGAPAEQIKLMNADTDRRIQMAQMRQNNPELLQSAPKDVSPYIQQSAEDVQKPSFGNQVVAHGVGLGPGQYNLPDKHMPGPTTLGSGPTEANVFANGGPGQPFATDMTGITGFNPGGGSPAPVAAPVTPPTVAGSSQDFAASGGVDPELKMVPTDAHPQFGGGAQGAGSAVAGTPTGSSPYTNPMSQAPSMDISSGFNPTSLGGAGAVASTGSTANNISGGMGGGGSSLLNGLDRMNGGPKAGFNPPSLHDVATAGGGFGASSGNTNPAFNPAGNPAVSTGPVSTDALQASAAPSKPAYDPNAITPELMRKYRHITAANNMGSDMDKWKTWQAMNGAGHQSNQDYRNWKAGQ